MISVRFQGKPLTTTVIQVYAPTSNAEEAEVERFYEDLQDLLELTPKKNVGSQETPGVTGIFGLGVQNEAGQTLIEFCQENALVIANTLFQQHKRRLYTWILPEGQILTKLLCLPTRTPFFLSCTTEREQPCWAQASFPASQVEVSVKSHTFRAAGPAGMHAFYDSYVV